MAPRRWYVHIRADIARTPAFLSLRWKLGLRTPYLLGLIATQNRRVAGWIAEHPELVRPPKIRRRKAGTRPRRPDIPRRIRQAVFARDGYRCAICGEITDRPTIDHIEFYSRGGSDDPSNLRTACPPCNSRRQPKRRTTEVLA